ncbi:MAG: hypothetical protein IJU16_04765 [Clostridia bacterium]|nr:hypothetical protein [Clostridia bacterium]
MSELKGKVEATVQLTKSNCYYMNHGVCSLSIVEDFFIDPGERLPQNDLFYCPRLYAQMTGKNTLRPVPVVPCDCGHLQIISGHQRACISQRRSLTLPVRVDESRGERAFCAVCGGQTTMRDKEGREDAGKRILLLHARAEMDD